MDELDTSSGVGSATTSPPEQLAAERGRRLLDAPALKPAHRAA
jgi:hypothetical protein